ncbi:hypothetical protein ALPO108162_09115 [Alicyclobacillus pomorum]
MPLSTMSVCGFSVDYNLRRSGGMDYDECDNFITILRGRVRRETVNSRPVVTHHAKPTSRFWRHELVQIQCRRYSPDERRSQSRGMMGIRVRMSTCVHLPRTTKSNDQTQ